MGTKRIVKLLVVLMAVAALPVMIVEAEKDRPIKEPTAPPEVSSEWFYYMPEQETNDSRGSANPMYCGSGVYGTIDPAGDEDYFEFYGYGDDHIVAFVEANRYGSYLDPILSLYDADGNLLTRNDDFSGLDSRVHYTLPDEGTYYLRVEDFGTPEGGPDSWYNLYLDQVSYVSIRGRGEVNNSYVRYGQNDIMAYYPCSGTWEMLFDASDVGLGNTNLTDFAILPYGNLLLTFSGPQYVPGVGHVDGQDVVIFYGWQLGWYTEGSFDMFLDGSDVGLEADSEVIDSLSVDSYGNLIIGTTGHAEVPGIDRDVRDEDLMTFYADSYGYDTTGWWGLFLNGSRELPNSADVLGVWYDANHVYTDLYMSFQRDTRVAPRQMINKADIGLCWLSNPGEYSNCSWLGHEFWGRYAGLGRKLVDGIALGESPWPYPGLGFTAQSEK